MRCPNCGGDIEADHRDGSFVVCPYCRSASIIDMEAARLAGTMAVLARPSGKLRVGRSGRAAGRNFHVLGRVRYGYEAGFWDEWYLRFEDGEPGWLSEDEGRFSLETLHDWSPTPELWASLRPGDEVPFPETAFRVRERGTAICEGGEGQLPFAVESGELVPFLDCVGTDTDAFLTLEFPGEETPRAFVGVPFAIDGLEIDTEDDHDDDFAVSAAAGSRERVHLDENRSRAISCDACGANLGVPEAGAEHLECEFCGAEVDLDLKRIDCPECRHPVTLHDAERAESSVCPNCEAQLDVRQDEIAVLGQLAERHMGKPRLPIGARFDFKGYTWRIAGALVWLQSDEDGEYRTQEFLMHAPEAGYAWLSIYRGHCVWYEELMRVPATADVKFLSRKKSFRHAGQRWRVFERDFAEIESVWGEMPWVARVGDRVRFMDAISPPFVLSAEWTDDEMEWFRGQYLEPEVVAEAFDLPASELPHPRGVGAAQPYRQSAFRRASGKLMLAATALAFCLLVFAIIKRGNRVTTFEVAHADFEKPWLSEPFEITDAPSVCRAEFDANVNNSWVYLDVAVVDAEDLAVLDFSAEISYYHGTEGGERWTEGSTSRSVPFVIEKPGTYRFLIMGQAGFADHPIAAAKSPFRVQVEVREGAILARWFLVLLLICIVWVLCIYVPRWTFEAKRWADE